MTTAVLFNFIARDGTSLNFSRKIAPKISPTVKDRVNKQFKSELGVRVRNSKYDNEYNCHGLTFAAKLGWFFDVRLMLKSHDYKQIGFCANFDIDKIPIDIPVMRGDIVVYYLGDESKVTHTGIIWSKRIRNGGLELTVLSKWGSHSEYFHRHDKVPVAVYGKTIEIWTDRNI